MIRANLVKVGTTMVFILLFFTFPFLCSSFFFLLLNYFYFLLNSYFIIYYSKNLTLKKLFMISGKMCICLSAFYKEGKHSFCVEGVLIYLEN